MPVFYHLAAFFTTLLLLWGATLYDQVEEENLQNRQRSEMIREMSAIRASLEGSINSTLHLAQGMIAYVAVHPNLTQDEFTAMARELMRQRSHIRNITLVKGERITYLYPIEPNKAVLGLNIFEHPVQGASAKLALAEGRTVVGGPYELVQGGRAFISRTPIYLRQNGQNVYWGMASIPLNFDGVIGDSNLLASRTLKIALRGRDGLGDRGDVFLGDPEIFNNPQAVLMSVSLPQGSWQMGAVLKQPGSPSIWRTVTGIVAALAFGFLVWSLLFLRHRQRLMGAEIQSREQAWRTLTENLREVVFWTDEKGGMVYLSASAQLMQLSVPTGASWALMLSDREIKRAEELTELLLKGVAESFQERFRIDRGRYVEVHAGRMPLQHGGFGLAGTVTEVTERVEAERLLNESRRDLAESQRIARLGGWQYDLHNSMMTLSAEHRRINGEEDPIGPLVLPIERFLRDYVHPQDVSTVRSALARMAADHENNDYHDTFEFRLITRKGKVLSSWVHVRKRQDEPGIFIGVTQDITPLKEAQMALKASEERYRGFLEKLSDGVVVTQNGIIRYANEAMSKLVGYPRSEILGSQVSGYVSDEDRTRLMEFHRRRMMGLPSPNEYELTMVRKDGSVRMVRNNASMTEWDGQPASIATVTDISDRKAYENLLLLQKKQHEELLIQQSKMAAMGEMIAAIIHQFKQPMSVISLILQELPEELAAGELTPEMMASLTKQAQDQVDYMSKTADDFRNFFRPEKERTRFDPVVSIAEVEKLLSRQLNAASVKIVHTPSPSCEVRGVSNEFKQVILNLITNAKDAITQARKGGKLKQDEEGAIHIATHLDGPGHVKVTVEDNGGGIPEAIVARVFEPYFNTKEHGGTGVGLYMSRTIIESGFNGSIGVENGEKGARFTVRLPCA